MIEDSGCEFTPDDETNIRDGRCFDFSMVTPYPRRGDIVCALAAAWQLVVRSGLDSIDGCMMVPVRLESAACRDHTMAA